jgi:drug/metabolite transporter (DMT)-like permease
MRRMSMKAIACLAFLCNTTLFATYYAITKEALTRIDPLIFTYFEMMTLVPVALGILILNWHTLTRAVVKRGMLLGSSLCLALFTIAIALKYTSATGTAFFPALNGFLAALLAWVFFRQPLGKATWVAGFFSVLGAALLILNSPMGGVRGALIAFLGGLFFTGYVFLSDSAPKEDLPPWPVFGIELLTTAAWANLVVLLFGDWQAVHPTLPKDVLIILYVATACTFLPTLIALLMQKYISPVTVSFIYILEPVLGAVFALFYLHETLPLNGYLGGCLVVVGALIQTWGSLQQSSSRASVASSRASVAGLVSYIPAILPSLSGVLVSCGGAVALYMFGGFPPQAWRTLFALAPSLFVSLQNGQGVSALSLLASTVNGQNVSLTMVLVQSAGWLIAWVVLAFMLSVSSSRLFAILGTLPARVLASLPTQAMPTVSVAEPEPALAVNTRMLRQMGVTPHTLASVKRGGEKPLVQRRRKQRQQRLISIEYSYSYDYDAPLETVEM